MFNSKKEIVIVNQNGELLNTADGKVIIFNSREDAIKCVDDGRTYLDLDYSQICERIVFADNGKEVFDPSKVYFD